MERGQSSYAAVWEEFLRTKNFIHMVDLCQIIQLQKIEAFPQNFFKLFISALMEYFTVSVRNEFTLDNIFRDLVPMIKVFYDCYKLNMQALDAHFFEKTKEFVKKIISRQLSTEPEQELMLSFMIMIIELFDIVAEYKFITGTDERLLQVFYNFYQNLLFYTFSNSELRLVFNTPFVPEEKRLKKILGEKNEIIDLNLYILYNLKKVAEKITQMTDPNLSSFFGNIMKATNEIQDFKDFTHSQYSILAVKKSQQILLCQKILFSKNAKKDQLRTFLGLYLERFKELFYLNVIHSLKYFPLSNCTSFSKDSSSLGLIFSYSCSIFTESIYNDDLESLLLSLLSLIINQDISQPLPLILYTYILQFIKKYFKNLGLRSTRSMLLNNQDAGLVGLLFHKDLFYCGSNQSNELLELSHKARESWGKIWQLLCRNPKNYQWLSNAVVVSIHSYFDDFTYIVKIKEWIVNELQTNEQFIRECIKFCFIEENLMLLKKKVHDLEHRDNVLALFQIINSISSVKELFQNVNPSNMTRLLCDMNLVGIEEYSDITFKCIGDVMKIVHSESHMIIKSFLEKLTNGNLLLKLIHVILGVLRSSKNNSEINLPLCKTGWFGSLRNKFIVDLPHLDTENQVRIWIGLMDIIAILLENNEFTQQKVGQFEFEAIAETLRSPKLDASRNDICRLSINTLFCIMYDRKNIDENQRIRIPEIIPLVLTNLMYLPNCDVMETARRRFILMLFTRNSLPYLAKFSCVKISLYYFTHIHEDSISTLFEKVLASVIPYNILPQELNQLLGLIKTSNNAKKIGLLQCLEQSVSNSFIENRQMKLSVNPTKFFAFRNKKFLCCNLPEEKMPKKGEFSIFFWIYISKIRSKLSIIELIDKNNKKLKVKFTDSHIYVIQTEGKKKFTARAEVSLKQAEWNFVGISMHSLKVSKVLKIKESINIYFADSMLTCTTQGTLSTSIGNFKLLYIGKSSKHSKIFDGRISSFYISNTFYTLDRYNFISNLSPLYISDFIPYSLSSWYGLKIYKNDVFETLSFYCTPYTNFSQEKIGIHIENDCEKFNGTNIVESLVALGGVKTLFNLIEIEEYNETATILVLKIILHIIKCQEIWMIIDAEFIYLLGHLLLSFPNTSTLTEYIFKIGIALKGNLYQQEYLKIIQLSDKMISIPISDRQKFLSLFINLLKKSFGCTKESLYMIYNYVKDFPYDSDSFNEIFQKFVHEDLDTESVKGINLLLYISTDSLLHGVVKLLMQRNAQIELGLPTEATLLYSLENNLNPKTKIEIVALLTLKTFRKQSLTVEEEINYAINISEGIASALEQNFDSEFAREIVEFIAKNKVRMIKSSPKLLCRIVTSKLREGIHKSEIVFNSLLDFSNKLAKMIYKSDDFPGWMINCYERYPESQHILNPLSVSLIVLQPMLSNFNKTRILLTEIASSDINALEVYQKVLGALKINFISPKLFLDFLGILEDILPKNLEDFSKQYKLIIKDLFSVGKALKLLKSSTPYVKQLQISEIRSMLKLGPKRQTLEDDIYLKEGGFYRLILKYLLIGISIDNSGDYLQIIEEILISEEITQIDGKFSLFSDIFAYQSNAPVSSDYFDLYLFCEIVEILYFTKNSASLFVDFLLIFLLDFKVYEKLLEVLNNITKEDFVNFRLLLSESLDSIYPSWRNHCDIETRARFTEILPGLESLLANSMVFHDDLAYYKIFIGKMSERMLQFRQALNSSEALVALMKSKEWIQDVHMYLMTITSVRLNLGSSTSQYYKLTNKSADSNRKNEKQQSYSNPGEYLMIIKKTQAEWMQGTQEAQSRYRNYINVRYKKFKKSQKILESVISNTDSEQYKIRSHADNCYRHVFTKPFRLSKSPQPSFASCSIPNKFFESYSDSLHDLADSDMEIVELEEEKDYSSSSSTSIECERITIQGSCFGKIEVDHKYLAFFSEGSLKPETSEYTGSALGFTQERKICNYIWEISEISEVVPRRFIHRSTALEIFMKSGKSFFFNTFSTSSRKLLFESMKPWMESGVIVHTQLSNKLIAVYTTKWKKGKLSNFEYLMVLNKYGNRSVNDISQYPIFPWVTTDFFSDTIDINNEEIYRDLACPIGAISEVNKAEAKKRYEMISPADEMEPFHYGSHYLSGSNVSYYLIRFEPFTSQAKKIQNNSFDVADRLFHNLGGSWGSCLSINCDVKELIPEFYYFPDFLYNVNSYPLGTTQAGKDVSTVELPPWAHHSAVNFIRIHRELLESPAVSRTLHNWIDLIFGYKQQGPAAVESLNVFTPASYPKKFEKLVRIEPNVQGLIDEAYFFGQAPSMIFSRPHEKREEIERKESCCTRILANPGNGVDCVCTPLERPGKICAVLLCGKMVLVLKCEGSRYLLLKLKSFKLQEEVQMQNFNLLEPSQWVPGIYWKHTFPEDITMTLDFGGNTFSVFQERLLVSALHTDSSLRIHSLDGVIFACLLIHPGLVSSVCCTAKYILSGGLGCSVIAWDTNTEYKTYLGHTHAIRQIQASEAFQVLLSLDCAGLILLHDLRTAECLRKISTSYERPPKACALSESGVIAVAFTEEGKVGFYSINGCEVWEAALAESVWCLKFDRSGEHLVCGSTESVSIVEVFGRKVYRTEVESAVIDIEIMQEEEGICFVLHQPEEPKIYFISPRS